MIPSYLDPYHEKTVADIFKNSALGDALEVISVWDGYYPSWEIIEDPRRTFVHLGSNRGMRGAINIGIEIAKGEYFMRLDEHCAFGKGFDKILTDDCKENEVMTATRYFLNPEKWEVMDIPPVYHERLDIINVSEGVRKFHGKPWKEMDHWMRKKQISETEAMQGSMWIANREFFLKTVGILDSDNYGPLIQDSVEVTFKYWQAGGRLMLNKNAWFAHKHRSFKRTHNNGTPENPAQYEKGYAYALSQFEEFYKKNILPKRV